MKLFMLLLGCKPAARNTEQHDVFFGIAEELRDLVPSIQAFWEGSGKIHLDAWREVTSVDGYTIRVRERSERESSASKLFFINLGGYKPDLFEELHYKVLAIGASQAEAISKAKQTAFFKHTGIGPNSGAHVDDKYGVDADDVFEVKEILPPALKEKYFIEIEEGTAADDEIHLGFFRLHEL